MNALQARLKRYKDNAAAMAARYPQSAHYADWRNNRYPKPAILKSRNQINRRQEDRTVIYADSFDCLPLTLVGDACDFGRNIPCGWYTDDMEIETLKGAVLSFRNPHRTSSDENENSHVFYLAANYHSDWDGVTVYTDMIHATILDAALYADECARIEAEKCREQAELDYMEQRKDEAKTELHGLNKNTLQLIKEIKQARQRFTPAICQALTSSLKAALRERGELLRTIETGV